MIGPLLLTLVTTLAPQVVTYEKINKSSPTQKIAFDWNGLSTDGAPIALELGVFVFNVHPAPATPPAGIFVPTTVPPKAGVNQYLVKDLTRTVPAGRYSLVAQLKSAAGVFSAVSNVIFVEVVNEVTPAAAQRLRVVE